MMRIGRTGLVRDGQQDRRRLFLGLGAHGVEARVLDRLPRLVRGLLGVDALLLQRLQPVLQVVGDDRAVRRIVGGVEHLALERLALVRRNCCVVT